MESLEQNIHGFNERSTTISSNDSQNNKSLSHKSPTGKNCRADVLHFLTTALSSFALMLLFSVTLISKAYADCKFPYQGECYIWNPGVENNCGEGCTYTYNPATATVYIHASGPDAKIQTYAFRPKSHDGNSIDVPITNIIIDGPIEVGLQSFDELEATITGADGTLVLNGIGRIALRKAVIDSDVIIPADASLDMIALYKANIKGKIYCALDNCDEVLRQSCLAYLDTNESIANECLTQMEALISDDDKFEQAPVGCTVYSADGCGGCLSNYYKHNNQCSRCAAGCTSCNDGDTCKSCAEGYLMIDNICYADCDGEPCEVIECGAGQYLDGSMCKTCKAGTYALAGDNACTDCGEHEYSAAGSEFCSVRQNVSHCDTFAADSDKCSKCGEGYQSKNGSCVAICTDDKVFWKDDCLDEYPFAQKSYTPDEASQWLKEDDNIVTIIFKK